MKAVMVMFDSLNRNYLPNYGSQGQELAQFQRLGEKTVTFDCNYAGSLPCMPARRELHTGRYNFLHREWGPLEPFDDSMPELLKKAGVYTHLISDHIHYWEDGGATYHSRYSSWQNVRGQEGDTWIPAVGIRDQGQYLSEVQPGTPPFEGRIHHCANQQFIESRGEYPQEETFRAGMDFIRQHHEQDRWFLQIETFDPHEPFDVPERFLNQFCSEQDPDYNWPPYGAAFYPPEVEQGLRNRYRALLGLCDECLGKILDLFDQYDLWKDTLLIVNTDHGFLLGEKHWWGKNIMPVYNEIAHTPLFIWDPRSQKRKERRRSLTQTIDLAPTLLEFFQVAIPGDMQGKPLRHTVEEDTPVRSYALYGNFGAQINITDGQWQYMRAPVSMENTPLFCYTQMPANLMGRFPAQKMKQMELAKPFQFTKETPVMKIPVQDYFNQVLPKYKFGNRLFLWDAEQNRQYEVHDPQKERELVNAMVQLMRDTDAPKEQFERMGLSEGTMTMEDLETEKNAREDALKPEICREYHWEESAVWEFRKIREILTEKYPAEQLAMKLRNVLDGNGQSVITEQVILQLWDTVCENNECGKYETIRLEGVC